MKIINWGIIGLGNIAHEFSKAFAKTKNAKLLAIASKDENKIKKFISHKKRIYRRMYATFK